MQRSGKNDPPWNLMDGCGVSRVVGASVAKGSLDFGCQVKAGRWMGRKWWSENKTLEIEIVENL